MGGRAREGLRVVFGLGEVTGAYPAFVEVFFYCLRLPGLGKLVRAVGANELLFILISHLANSTLCVNWHHRPV